MLAAGEGTKRTRGVRVGVLVGGVHERIKDLIGEVMLKLASEALVREASVEIVTGLRGRLLESRLPKVHTNLEGGVELLVQGLQHAGGGTGGVG